MLDIASDKNIKLQEAELNTWRANSKKAAIEEVMEQYENIETTLKTLKDALNI